MALCNEENALVCNAFIFPDDMWQLCKNDSFRKLPKYPLKVEGTVILFTVDSGASRSVIRTCDLQCLPRLSDDIHVSLSASGHQLTDRFTEPLICETKSGHTLNHKFIMSPNCPIPLIGRDLMCSLGLTLIANSEGIKIIETEQSFLLEIPKWAYEWGVKDENWASLMCKRAKDRVESQNVDIMTSTELYCTSHVVVDRDESFEREWLAEPIRDKLCFNCMFWNDHMCALSVSLTEEQSVFYLVAGSVPHLSLAKAVNQ